MSRIWLYANIFYAWSLFCSKYHSLDLEVYAEYSKCTVSHSKIIFNSKIHLIFVELNNIITEIINYGNVLKNSLEITLAMVFTVYALICLFIL